MKKLLVFISLILCFSMLFTACASKTQDEELSQVEDNVEANIDSIVGQLNKYDTLDDLLNMTTTEIDVKDLAEEFKKISAQGSVDLIATTDGEEVGSLEGSFAISNNKLHGEATVDGYTAGIDAEITNALEVVFAAWSEDGVEGAAAFNLNDFIDTYMEMASESVNAEEMPFELSEIKLPEFKEDDIKYEDGKYILDKNFLYNAIVATADSIIDAAKNNGEEIPEDFDEEYEEIKAVAKNVVDAVDFEIYFLVTSEVFQGMGVSANLVMENLYDALGDYADEDMLEVEYIKLAAEVSVKGEKFDFEYKEAEDDHVNKINAEVKYIFDGKALCGLEANANVDVKSSSGYDSDDYSYNSTSNSKMTLKAVLDLSQFDKANATVLDFSMSATSDYTSNDKYSDGTTYSDSNKSETTATATIKTTEANKADVNFTATQSSDRVSNDNKDSYESTIGLSGKMEYSDKNVTVPAPDADVKDAMDEALANPISPEDMMGSSYPEENYPAIPDYSEDDYYYGEITTMVPEEEW